MSSVYMIYVFRQQESESTQPSWRSELSSRWVSYSRWRCILGQRGAVVVIMRAHRMMGVHLNPLGLERTRGRLRWRIWLWSERNTRRVDVVDASKILANSPNKNETAIRYYREMRIGENGKAHTLAILGHSGKGGEPLWQLGIYMPIVTVIWTN